MSTLSSPEFDLKGTIPQDVLFLNFGPEILNQCPIEVFASFHLELGPLGSN
jgi:hypothetical protein